MGNTDTWGGGELSFFFLLLLSCFPKMSHSAPPHKGLLTYTLPTLQKKGAASDPKAGQSSLPTFSFFSPFRLLRKNRPPFLLLPRSSRRKWLAEEKATQLFISSSTQIRASQSSVLFLFRGPEFASFAFAFGMTTSDSKIKKKIV